MENKIETREITVPVEIKEDYVLNGYAVVWNSWSNPLKDKRSGKFYIERISENAFDESIETEDIRATYNHMGSFILGRTKNNTLVLEKDEKGLKFEIKLNPEDTDHQNIFQRAKRQDLDGMSFEFIVKKEKQEPINLKAYKRTIESGKLIAVNPVVTPAYSSSILEVRSEVDAVEELNRKVKETEPKEEPKENKAEPKENKEENKEENKNKKEELLEKDSNKKVDMTAYWQRLAKL